MKKVGGSPSPHPVGIPLGFSSQGTISKAVGRSHVGAVRAMPPGLLEGF